MPKVMTGIWLVRIILVALGMAIWLVHAYLPVDSAADQADESWTQLLHYGFAHGWQWGRDLIFTYGPLGITAGLLYDPRTWPYLLAWYFTVHVFEVGLLVYSASRLPRWWMRCGCLILCLLVTPLLPRELLHQVTLVLATCVQFCDSRPRLIPLLLILGLAATLAFVKFTLFLLSALLICLLIFDAFLKQGWRTGLGATVFTVATGIGVWMACGQKLALLPSYFISSLQISSGYVTAMQVEGDSTELLFAAIGGTAFGLLILALANSGGSRRSRLLICSALIATAFLFWKHGFVRHDSHSLVFFTGLPLLTFAAWLPVAHGRTWNWLKGIAFVAVLSVCLTAAWKRASQERMPSNPIDLGKVIARRNATNVKALLELNRHQAEAELRRKELQREWLIPELKARVGTEPIAWLMNSQGIPLLNDLKIAPRGVPQSYSAYTEALANRNAEYFRSPAAPKYVVVRAEAFEGRFPMADDGPALLEILTRYRPLDNYGGFVLFEKSFETHIATRDVILEKEVGLGEIVELSQLGPGAKTLSVDISTTIRGRLIREAYKPPRMWIEVQSADKAWHHLRLIPDMSRTEFLLDPLVLDNGDFVNLIAQVVPRSVERFRVVVDGVRTGSYSERLTVRLRNFDLGWKSEAVRSDQFLYPGLFAAPQEIHATKSRVALRRGRSVLAHSVPAYVRFAVPEGKRSVKGIFGLLPELMKLPPVPDGIVFAITFTNKAGLETQLLRRRLDPWLAPADAEPQEFKVRIPSEESGSLKLIVVAGNIRVDGCYWSDIALQK